MWAHASSMAGVNFELGPWIRMTHPGWADDLRSFDPAAGRDGFGSWLLLVGVLPFDRHALHLDAVDERSFVEESHSWLQRRWRHERTVEPAGPGCRVTDRLVVEPRLRPARPFAAAMVRAVFAHRHRRLRSRFGVAGTVRT